MEYVLKTISYYELFCADKDGKKIACPIKEILNKIKTLNKNKAKSRILSSGTDIVTCSRDVVFYDSPERIRGKLTNVFMSAFPEILNIEKNNLRNIEALETEGIAETTHFIIYFPRNSPNAILSLENNQKGPKIRDVQRFFNYILGKIGKADYSLAPVLIVRDTMQAFKERINRCSKLVFRVHRDRFKDMEEWSPGLGTFLNETDLVDQARHVEISIKIDYNQHEDTPNMKRKVGEVIKRFSGKEDFNPFEVFKLEAEDLKNGNKIDKFDFIKDRLTSKLNIQKNPRSRCILSADMYEKQEQELYRLFHNSNGR